MILGTAGHIDHGKTALVRALTGVDTDRLPEEQRRGITIELGFAPLHLADAGTVGVVDVPGHEAFVRTMLAGATGVDIALLVIAADEGVMPQTREHLAILSLLGVRCGVVALTKTDLVESEWLRLVEEDVRSALRDTLLQDAPIVAVSAVTGAGLDTLRAAIAAAAQTAGAAHARDDLFRMPVDRVFTMRGTGTVVTGTVWSGELGRGSAWIHPPGRAVRVRDLQTHGASVDAVRRGMRAAVALSDATVGEIERGAVLLASSDWPPTSVLRATFTRVPGTGVGIGARTRIRLHLGSADIGARVVSLGRGQVRIHLERPTICRGGDRFIIRGGPQLTTLGGGVVLDPFTRPRSRALDVAVSGADERLTLDEPDPAAVLEALVRERSVHGLELSALQLHLALPPDGITKILRSPDLLITPARVYTRELLQPLGGRLVQMVNEAHERDPLGSGLPVSEARASLGVQGDLFDVVVRDRADEAVVTGAHVHRPGWAPALSTEQTMLADQMMHAFCSAPEQTVTLGQIAEAFGSSALPVLRFLETQGRAVRLGEGLVAAEEVVQTLVARVQAHMAPGRAYTPAELRDALGVSRKLLIPLLEYCDRTRVTERRGAGRVLRTGMG